jgi:predicted nuclease of predicted toxin-antitoxin system
MNIYLDDDSAAALLVRLLAREGHDAQLPADVSMSGENDPVHLRHAIDEGRVLLSRNYDDFKELHELVIASGGKHPGLLLVRQDNNPKRDMNAPLIVRAIRNLLGSGIPIPNDLHILNHWR